jgi:hypothetical protein
MIDTNTIKEVVAITGNSTLSQLQGVIIAALSLVSAFLGYLGHRTAYNHGVKAEKQRN